LKQAFRLAFLLLPLLFVAGGVTSTGAADQSTLLREKISHIIVIYQENWSFDSLYAKFPGADGSSGPVHQVQYGTVDPSTGKCASPVYVEMLLLKQQPLFGQANPKGPWPCDWTDANGTFSVAAASGTNPDPAYSAIFANGGSMPARPFDVGAFDPIDDLTGDIWHIFWHEQIQIDNGALEPSNGNMDKFVAYSGNPGYVLSQYDATNLPEGQLAQRFTMADRFFHSAYGGSFLNHQWLICACTPTWNGALPKSNPGFASYWNPEPGYERVARRQRDAHADPANAPRSARRAVLRRQHLVHVADSAPAQLRTECDAARSAHAADSAQHEDDRRLARRP
jgi:phospholipase C